MATRVSKHLVGSSKAAGLRPPSSEESELQGATAAILAPINNLQGALESGHLRSGPGDEAGPDGKPATAYTPVWVPLLEENRAKRTSASLTQLRTDLDGLRQLKPLPEDVSRHLSAFKALETPDRHPASCARSSSYSFVDKETLRQMVEHAVAPILEELKQRVPPPGTCPSCQCLQKKIMDLEQSALEAHIQAVALRSNAWPRMKP